MIQIPLKTGHHLPASETPFNWMLAWYIVALWIFMGSGPVLLWKPVFCDFSGMGGGRTSCPTSGSAYGIHCLFKLKWFSNKKIQYVFESYSLTPLDMCTWLRPKFLVSNQKEESISTCIQMVTLYQIQLFHRQNAVRNFLIPSTWPAYPIHMTCLSHPRDFKL